MTTEKKFVVVGVSLGTGVLLTAFCLAICLSYVFTSHSPVSVPVPAPNFPTQGSISSKEINDLKYGPVNLNAAKEVKEGIFSRLRARRIAACQPGTNANCSPVTYETRPIAVPVAPPASRPSTCPDGSCDAPYVTPVPSTNVPLPSGSINPTGTFKEPLLPGDDVGSLGSLPSEDALEAVPPDDSDRMQLLVIARADQSPATWFDSDPMLSRVKNSVSFTRIDPGSVMHRERYGDLGTNAPIVALTWPDARTIYFADRDSLPSFSSSLFSEMKSAVTAARNAKKSSDLQIFPASFALASNPSSSNSDQDCPDGTCVPNTPDTNDGFRFPRLRPNSRPNDNPLLAVAEGFIKDGIESGIWLVFSAVALCFVMLFGILLLGAIIVVAKWGGV